MSYVNFSGLVPCPPEEAEGISGTLSTNVTYNLVVRITDLIVRDGGIWGLRLEHASAATLCLQATDDFSHWADVAYLHANAGTTTWQASQDLSAGSYFRLRYVAYGHVPFETLPPL